jgi:hypothetical protein
LGDRAEHGRIGEDEALQMGEGRGCDSWDREIAGSSWYCEIVGSEVEGAMDKVGGLPKSGRH